MNFKPDLIQKILAGEKTQTRRIIKPGERIGWAPDTAFTAAGRLKWRARQVYAIAPGRGKAGVGYILLKSIDISTANEISEEDARAEGFANRQAFLDRWDEINGVGKRYVRCWVLEFELWTPLSQEYFEDKLKDLDPIQYKRLMFGEWPAPDQNEPAP